MISVRRAEARHHEPRRRPRVWRTFDPRAPTDGLNERFAALAALDENLLPPRADVVRYPRGDSEIVTYVREGTLAYRDETGHSGVVCAGEFQRMITAPRFHHGEANASRTQWVHVFQIRLRCPAGELAPGREQKRFSAADRRGGLCVVASPDGRSGSLRLHQDARMYSALLEPGQHVVHEVVPARAAWLHVVLGEIALGDLVLTAGDGAGVTSERAVSLTARERAEILLLDVVDPGGGARVADAPGMTINTSNDPQPTGEPGVVTEQSSASTTPPNLAVQQAPPEPDLEARIKVRRAKLATKLGELKADMRPGVAEARTKVQARLSELAHIVKWGIVDGWANVSGPVAGKLERWLTDSAQQVANKNGQSS